MASQLPFTLWFRPSRLVVLAALLFIIGFVGLMIMFEREATWRNTQNQARNTLQLAKMLQQEIGDELKNSNNFIALIESQFAKPAPPTDTALSAFLDSHMRLLSDIQEVMIADATGIIIAQSNRDIPRTSATKSPQSIAEDALFIAISKATTSARMIRMDGVGKAEKSTAFTIGARLQYANQTPLTPDRFIMLRLSAAHFNRLLHSVTSINDGGAIEASLLHVDGSAIAASKNAVPQPWPLQKDGATQYLALKLAPTTWLAQAIAREFTALEPVCLVDVDAPVFVPVDASSTESRPGSVVRAPDLAPTYTGNRAQLSYAQLRDWPLAVAVWATQTQATTQSSYSTQPIARLHAAAALCLIISICALAASRALQQRERSQLALRESQDRLRLLSDDLAQAQRIGRFGRWHWQLDTDIITFSDDYAEFMQVETGPAPQTMRNWIIKITHPEEVDLALAHYRDRNTAEPFGRERRIVSRHGEVRWCYTAGEPIFDASRALIAFRGITRDITEAKNAAIQQRKLAQELQAAQTIAQMGHFTWLLADDTVTVSASFDGLYEIVSGVRPTTARELIENFTEGQHQLHAMTTYATRHLGQPFRLDRQIITQQKNRKWIETIATPFFDANGKLLGYHGVQRDISATKEATMAVAQSEERYRLIADNMLDIVCLHDGDSTVRYVSQSLTRLLGYRQKASIGVRFNTLIHPDDLNAVLLAHSLLQTSDASRSTVECRIRSLSGSYVWLESIVTKVADGISGAENMFFQVVARDATLRKQAEAAMQASETRFRQLTQLSSDWYWETDVEGRFTFMSRSHPIIHRIPVAEMIGQYPHIIFPRHISAAHRAEHAQLVALRQPFRNIAITVHDAHGNIVAHATSNGEPYFNRDGSFVGYRGTGRDVSAEKFALNALKTSSQRFESLTKLSADWYWEQDTDYRFTFYSHPTIVGSNTPSAIFYGKTRWELYPEALTDAQWAQHRTLLEARLPFYDLVLAVKAQSKNGIFPTDRYFAISGTPIFDANDVFIGYRGTGRDLTIAKRAEVALERHAVQLERANVLLDQEATRRMELERNTLISIEMELAEVGLELHDQLGQDLTGIAFLIKILEKHLSATQSNDALEAAKIGGLVSQAIKHTRMISHGLSPYIWGADGLLSAINQLSNDINMIGVAQCSATLDANIVIADDLVARSFYRIAQEATNNALKHGKATQIEISLTEADNIVALEISDNGIGVEQAAANAPNGAQQFPNKPGYSYSIQHRASLIGATVTVSANAGGGTVVTVLRAQDGLVATKNT